MTAGLARARAWAPALTLLLVVALVADSAGSLLFATFTALAVAAAALFTYWRVRLHRTDHPHIPLGDITVQVWRAWFLLRTWPKACQAARLGRQYRGVTPRLGRLRLQDDGSIRSIMRHGRYGVAQQQLRDRAGELAEYVGAHDLEVRSVPAPTGKWGRWARRSGVSELRIYFDDALGRVMKLRELPIAPAGQICVGRTRTRMPALIRSDLSTLIVGATGSGKSNLMWTMLADLIRQDVPVRLYVSDAKGGMELTALRDVLGVTDNPRFEVREYAATPAATTELLRRAKGAMQKRQQVMAGRKQRKHKPTLDDPLTIVLIDEFLALREQIKAGADGDLGLILSQGRACGYVVWGLTQDPVKDTIGPARDLMDQRLVLRLRSRSAMAVALGSSSAPAQTPDAPGVMLIDSEQSREVVMARGPFVTDAEAAMIARGVVPDMPGDEVHDPHTLYRYWGRLDPTQDEVLLYLGITNSFADRDRQHAVNAAWYPLVERVDSSEEWPSKRLAAQAEEAAIKAEQPVYNVHHNGDNPRRRTFTRKALARLGA